MFYSVGINIYSEVTLREQLQGDQGRSQVIHKFFQQRVGSEHQKVIFNMLGWMKHKLESRLLGEISITSYMQMTPPLWQKAKN